MSVTSEPLATAAFRRPLDPPRRTLLSEAGTNAIGAAEGTSP
ncbi:MAG TPA: hypothetical protein VLA56_08785 [Pseudomonadales bacterium]|nr:hypothetical protein [Pseudomonadales bacterium]